MALNTADFLNLQILEGILAYLSYGNGKSNVRLMTSLNDFHVLFLLEMNIYSA